MNKSDLIQGLVKLTDQKENLSEKKATDVVNLIFKSLTDELKRGGRVEIRGFGSFVVREYDSYTGRNPKTGNSIKVAAKRLPFFKVGKELRENVNSRK
jgi:integration host factor subunit beta